MAAITFRLADVTLSSAFGELIETDQAAANCGTSWKVAKTTSDNSGIMVWGTTGTANFTTESTNPKPTALGTSDTKALRSQNPYSGTFAATAWTLTFAVRAGTASSQRGRMRVRVYTSPNADGSGATEHTGSTQVGTTSLALSTTADVTTIVTWTPSAAFDVNNEYVFIECAWEITTASGSNSGDVILRTGTSAAGTNVVTSNLSPLDANTITSITDISGSTEVYTSGGTAYTESATITSIVDISSSVELVGYVDSNTISGTTTPSGSETYASTFPTTSVLDNFNRANENPLSDGGLWSSTPGPLSTLAALQIVSNAVKWQTSSSGAVWADATLGADEESYATISTLPAAGNSIRIWVRVVNPGLTTVNGYDLSYLQGTGFQFHICTSGTRTQLGSTISGSLAAGDKFGLSVVGSVLYAWKYTAGAWTLLGSYDTSSDATKYTAAGHIALEIRDGTAICDDFGGGTVVAGGTANTDSDTVGGTTSVGVYGDVYQYAGSFAPGVFPIFETAHIGPFAVGTSLYAFTYFNHDLHLWKSTDHGSTWIEQDPTNSPATEGSVLDVVLSGTTLYILHSGLDSHLYIKQYNTSTDTYGTLSPQGPTFNNNVVTTAAVLSVRSNGDCVVFHQSPTELISSTNYRRFSYSIYSAGAWSGLTTFGTGIADHYDLRCAVLGASDRIHFFYTKIASNNTLFHRSLDSSNALDTEASATTTLYQATTAYPVGTPVAFIKNGAVQIAVPYRDTATSNPMYVVYFTSGANPTLNKVLASSTVEAPNASSSNLAVIVADGVVKYILWAPTLTLHMSPDGGADTYNTATSTPTLVTRTDMISAISASNISGAGNYTNSIGVLYAFSPSLPMPPLFYLEQVLYDDVTTLSSKTSISSGEIYTPGGTAYTESATIASATSPTLTDVFAAVDSSTVGSTTTPSATEAAQFIDSATNASITVPTAIEIAQFVDSSTLTSKTVPSSVEEHDTYDSATISSKIVVSTIEVAAYVDSSTISSTTSPSSLEEHDTYDSATLSSSTSIVSADIVVHTESAIIQSATSITHVELHEISDAVAVNSTTTPTSSEQAQFVDASNIAIKTTLSAAETHELYDSATNSSQTQISSVEVAAFVDSNTISGTTSISSSEVYTPLAGASYTDSATVKSALSLSAVEVAAFVDSSTASSTTVVNSTEIAQLVDVSTTASITIPASTDLAVFVDSNTASNISVVSSTEVHEIYDSATLTSNSSLSTTEMSAFVDANTNSSTTAISSIEVHEISDAATTSSKTTLSSTDIAIFVDAATTSNITALGATELHDITDTNTVSSTNSLSATEFAAFIDANTINSTTEISSSEVLTGVKTTTIYRTRLTSLYPPSTTDPETLSVRARKANPTDSGILRVSIYEASTLIETYDITLTDIFTTDSHDLTNASAITSWTDIEVAIQGISDTGFDLTPQISWMQFEIPAYTAIEYDDGSAIVGSSSIASTEFAGFVDVNAPAGATVVNSAEIVLLIDAASVSTTTTPVSAELTTFVDSNTISSATAISSADVAVFVDSNTTSNSTTPSAVEYQTSAGVDTATISSNTAPSSADVAIYVDASTTTGKTFLTYVEVYGRVDNAILSGITTISAVERSQFVDATTLTGLTSLSADEFKLGTGTDAAIVLTTTVPLSSDVAAFVDQNTIGVKTASITSEFGQFLDQSTFSIITEISASEFTGAGKEDTATITSFTTLTYVEEVSYVEVETPQTGTTPSSTEAATYFDSATTASQTLTYAEEVYAVTLLDSSTIESFTSIVYEEFYKIQIVIFTGVIRNRWSMEFVRRWGANAIRTSKAEINSRWNKSGLQGKVGSEWIH